MEVDCISESRLLGTRSVVSGISPNIAATLVASDARLSDVRAHGTLEAALHDRVRSLEK